MIHKIVLLIFCLFYSSLSFADDEMDLMIAEASALQKQFDEYVKAGDEFYSVEQYENALVSYLKAVNLKTGPADLYRKMGDCSAAMGRYQEALIFAQRAVEVEPDNGKLHLDLAMSYYALKRKEEAKASLETARSLLTSEEDLADLAYVEEGLNND